MMKDFKLRLLSELMKNSRRSDRELARTLGVSQPTLSRVIKALEKEGYVKEYTAIPNFKKLDCELLAVIIAKRNPRQPGSALPKAEDFVKRHPNILFVASGMGLGSNRIAFSVHKNYADYSRFVEETKHEWQGLLDVEAFIVDLKGEDVLRSQSFKFLGDYLIGKE